ncbi:hypothetical protein [Janthinobacterium sp.]|uniref:hypothetical protein n=1 Tax=Janthinobacterium sp. TaxID=1871054 RepID=UPI002612A4F6|nr:hypothetical protein [Janthinobacterium sp.]
MGVKQPSVQFGQRRHGQALLQRQTWWVIESCALLLDRVQRCGAAQRLLSDEAAAGGLHVEELVPNWSHWHDSG